MRIMSPEDDTFLVFHISHRKLPEGEDVSNNPRPVADPFHREDGHSSSNSQRFRTVVVMDALKFLCNLIQGFVPGDRNKIAVLPPLVKKGGQATF